MDKEVLIKRIILAILDSVFGFMYLGSALVLFVAFGDKQEYFSPWMEKALSNEFFAFLFIISLFYTPIRILKLTRQLT